MLQDFDLDREPFRIFMSEMPESGTLTLQVELPPRKVIMIELN